MKKSATQKRIESKGWSVKTLVNGVVKATKNGVTVAADSMSEARFLIRFEKFYFGSDFIPAIENNNAVGVWTK